MNKICLNQTNKFLQLFIKLSSYVPIATSIVTYHQRKISLSLSVPRFILDF